MSCVFVVVVVLAILDMESRASCVLGKHSATELYLQPIIVFLDQDDKAQNHVLGQ